MIFAIGEDGVLSILLDLAAVQRDCEGIDVESDVWEFFDEEGFPLVPVFSIPNKTTKKFGIFSILASGVYDLQRTEDQGYPNLLESLTEGIVLEKNPFFKTVDEFKMFLTRRSTSLPSVTGRSAIKPRSAG
jgi:hypothetical protein